MTIDRKIRILVVDDELRFLETLKKRLELRDFDVTAVTSGKDALDAAGKADFDLALVDLKMPGMTGEEVLDALKDRHPDIEVVILTGHGSVDSAVHCIRAGSYTYLQKPCETDELLGALTDAYRLRVQRKLATDREMLDRMMKVDLAATPLTILRRLREIERTKK